MTREEIMAMEAGPEMDALIAEAYFGFYRVTDTTRDYEGVEHGNEILLPPGRSLEDVEPYLRRSGKMEFGYFVTHRYSNDITYAWCLAEKFWAVGVDWCRTANPVGMVTLYKHGGKRFAASAGTFSLAICRAALLAAEEAI